MPFYTHPNALDYGLVYIQDNTNQIALISDYAPADSYATVYGRRLASYVASSGSFAIGNDGLHRRIGTDDVLATAFGSTPPEYLLHVACLDTVSERVLLVVECLTNKPVISSQTITIPALIYTARQPVADV